MRLSLGKLWVNLVRVVKRTNTPLLPEKMVSSTDHGFLGHHGDRISNVVELRNVFSVVPRKWNRVGINTPARMMYLV